MATLTNGIEFRLKLFALAVITGQRTRLTSSFTRKTLPNWLLALSRQSILKAERVKLSTLHQSALFQSKQVLRDWVKSGREFFG